MHAKVYNYLNKRGSKPMFHWIDNEIPNKNNEILETTMGAIIKIVPLDWYRINAS